MLPSGLSCGSCLDEQLSQVRRSELPALIGLFANNGPGFYGLGRRRNYQGPIAKSSHERLNAGSQAYAEPGRRAQYDKQAENSNCNGSQRAMPIKSGGEPIENRVQRYRNDDAPDNDGQKWPDEDEGPVSQEAKADNSNGQNQEFSIRCAECQRPSIIVIHCPRSSLAIQLPRAKHSEKLAPFSSFPSSGIEASYRQRRQSGRCWEKISGTC